MRKRRSRAGEWATALIACVAILLIAWGVAMAAVMAFATAWDGEPMQELSEAQMAIAAETMREMKGE